MSTDRNKNQTHIQINTPISLHFGEGRKSKKELIGSLK